MEPIIRYIKPMRTQLRLYAPGEPGQHEQLTWLVLFIKDLRAKVKALTAEKEALAFQLKGNEPITDAEQELLDLRYQVQMLWYRNADLEKMCSKLKSKNGALKQALDEGAWNAFLAA